MRPALARITGLLLALAFGAVQSGSSRLPVQRKRIVIAASTLLDGQGHVLKNTLIVVEGNRIVAIDPNAGPVDYDLRGLTVLPGWIDSRVHITWSFDKNGRNQGAGVIARPQHGRVHRSRA